MTRAELRREQKEVSKLQQYMNNLDTMQKVIVQKTVNRILANTMDITYKELYRILRDFRISDERSTLIIAELKRSILKN